MNSLAFTARLFFVCVHYETAEEFRQKAKKRF